MAIAALAKKYQSAAVPERTWWTKVLAVPFATILLFGIFSGQARVLMAKLQVTVNKAKCISSEDCVQIAPGVFQLDGDGKSEAYNETGAPDDVIIAAAKGCPAKAITVVDTTSGTQIFPTPKK